jgi:hypothetical protein
MTDAPEPETGGSAAVACGQQDERSDGYLSPEIVAVLYARHRRLPPPPCFTLQEDDGAA